MDRPCERRGVYAGSMTLPSEDRERLLERLRRVDPPAFRGQVRAVLAAHGTIDGAAEALRIRGRSLRGWIAGDGSLVAGIELDDE